jgi:aconitate hydratase
MSSITRWSTGGVYRDGALNPATTKENNSAMTITGRILKSHDQTPSEAKATIRFDAIASHDITYVGVIQSARASGMTSFPLPYVLTNCHNSLCAVGGTINEDDHAFGISAALKYGGEFVPAHLAVIHAYMRERYAAPGKMILASDSHTRYGAYGTLGFGEGGPELVNQLLGQGYSLLRPEVVAVYLTGSLKFGVGPQDVALTLVSSTFADGFFKNRILEFIGPGVSELSQDIRDGIDVMTTETACLSSVWKTDKVVSDSLERFGRTGFIALEPDNGAYYDHVVEVDLSQIVCMIALPFHPSLAYPIEEFLDNAHEILEKTAQGAARQWNLPEVPPLTRMIEGKNVRVEQGIVAGCSGGLAQNIRAAARILDAKPPQNDAFSLSVYPASQPINVELTKDQTYLTLLRHGAVIRTAFCGPCFGAGDVPANGTFSIRHTTRNFPNREGSKPGDGQTAYVALMDARSIAATAAAGGLLTPASRCEKFSEDFPVQEYDITPYKARVLYAIGKGNPELQLRMGPNITDWPEIAPLPEDLLITVASVLMDPVTTTDELIPSGDASSYRSNPLKLAQMTLSRRDPGYVKRCEATKNTAIMALKPGDGSAREQAASCQRILGGVANIALEYATKRYVSNLINWGLLPLIWKELGSFVPSIGDTFEIKQVRRQIASGAETLDAIYTHGSASVAVSLHLMPLSSTEREILLAGCLMNYFHNKL